MTRNNPAIMYYLDAEELNLSHGGTQCIDLCVSPTQRVLTHTGQPKKQRGWKVLDRQSDKAFSTQISSSL